MAKQFAFFLISFFLLVSVNSWLLSDPDDYSQIIQPLKIANSNETKLYVKLEGYSPYFNTIQEAVDYVPEFTTSRYTIVVAPGIYNERVFIPSSKDFIALAGLHNKSLETVITANATGNVYSSATLTVESKFFNAKRLTIRNDADNGTLDQQAPAVRVSGDFAQFLDCFITGHAYTLYAYTGRQYYKRCIIQGSKDFIFGGARALFEESMIISNLQTNYTGHVTAQYRTLNTTDVSGFSFVGCHVTGTGEIYLGRPMADHALTVFMNSFLDRVVSPLGWDKWSDDNNDTGGVRYMEYNNWGPGSENRNKPLSQIDYFYSNKTMNNEFAPAMSFEEQNLYGTLQFVTGEQWVTIYHQ